MSFTFAATRVFFKIGRLKAFLARRVVWRLVASVFGRPSVRVLVVSMSMGPDCGMAARGEGGKGGSVVSSGGGAVGVPVRM